MTATAKAPARTKPAAAKAASEKAPDKAPEIKHCICGCGDQVRKLFKPGHDARWVSNLKFAVRDERMTPEAALAAAAEVSEALHRKLTRSLELLAQSQAKAQEKEDAR